jgi:hypothetical protein
LDSINRGENEGAMRPLMMMEQYGVEERLMIGSEWFIYFFGNLPASSLRGRGADASIRR